MTLVEINKTDHPITAVTILRHAGKYARSRVYQLTAKDPNAELKKQVAFHSADRIEYIMPAWSVSTIELTAR